MTVATPIPVTVVTGFLGAGKTTLLRSWLRAYDRADVAVIVNEVAAVGVDGELLRERVEAVIEVTGGCICCTTYAELVQALGMVAACAPQRIFVETSGAASPAGIVRAVHSNSLLALDGIIAVLDASEPDVLDAATPAGARGVSDLAAEQLGYADVVVLTRTDSASPDLVEAARAAAGRIAPAALVTAAIRGQLQEHADLASLLAGRLLAPAREAPSFRSHTGIESLVLAGDGDLDEERFSDWMEEELGAFEQRLLRVKGIVAIAGVEKRVILQGVADRLEVTVGAPWHAAPRGSRLVVIGFGLDTAALAQSFAGCAAESG